MSLLIIITVIVFIISFVADRQKTLQGIKNG